MANLFSVKNRNRRHHKEISATYTAIAIVTSFVVLHLPRILASTHEVFNTSLIITCIEARRQYIPPIDFYKMDFVARMLMVVNSAINFLIYCAISSPFQVRNLPSWSVTNCLEQAQRNATLSRNCGIYHPTDVEELYWHSG